MTNADIERINARITDIQIQVDALGRLVNGVWDKYYALRGEFLAHEQRPPEVK